MYFIRNGRILFHTVLNSREFTDAKQVIFSCEIPSFSRLFVYFLNILLPLVGGAKYRAERVCMSVRL